MENKHTWEEVKGTADLWIKCRFCARLEYATVGRNYEVRTDGIIIGECFNCADAFDKEIDLAVKRREEELKENIGNEKNCQNRGCEDCPHKVFTASPAKETAQEEKKCCGDCGFAQLPPKTGVDCVQPNCPCHSQETSQEKFGECHNPECQCEWRKRTWENSPAKEKTEGWILELKKDLISIRNGGFITPVLYRIARQISEAEKRGYDVGRNWYDYGAKEARKEERERIKNEVEKWKNDSRLVYCMDKVLQILSQE